MFMKIIMFVFCYPVLPIMYFLIKNELESHKNIILGVTIPADQLKNTQVAKIVDTTRKRMRITLLVCLVLPLASLFTRYDSIVYAIFMTWLAIICFIFFVPFVQGNLALTRLKKEQNWHIDVEDSSIVDLKVSLEEPNTLKKLLFVPAIILTVIPIGIELYRVTTNHSSIANLLFVASIGLITFLCPICFTIVYRMKQEIISTNSIYNQTLTRIRRYNWGKCWLYIAYANGLYTLLCWLYSIHVIESTLLFLTITLLYSLVVVASVLRAEFKVRLAQKQLAINTQDPLTIDEDSYWIYGLIYYNPNNTHLLVEKRVGIGTSINYAKPAGKVLAVFIALVLLVMPISSIGIIQSEFSPLILSIDGDSIAASHNRTTYDIKFSDIDTVETWDCLPDYSKDSGTGFSNLCKGSYSISGNGSCTVCFNPNNHIFIVITKKNGKKYVFSATTDQDTSSIYNQLEEQLAH